MGTCHPAGTPENNTSRQHDGKWVMVPKAHEDDSTLWRINFPEVEKKLMKDRGCMKPTIRLMKALREKQQWPLSSYSMKSLVVHHMLQKQERAHWDNKNQWTVFIHVLMRLHDVINPSGPGIRSVFDNNVSLIPDMSRATRSNIAGRLHNILNAVAKKPDRVLKFFPAKPPKIQVDSLLPVMKNVCDLFLISSLPATEVCEMFCRCHRCHQHCRLRHDKKTCSPRVNSSSKYMAGGTHHRSMSKRKDTRIDFPLGSRRHNATEQAEDNTAAQVTRMILLTTKTKSI